MKKILILAVLALSVSLIGCSAQEKPLEKQDGQNVQNETSSQEVGYDTTREVLEVEAKNTKIFYPQVKDYPGELLMDYMNQSLRSIADIYANEDPYSDVQIDYEITKMDENVLSVLYKGTGKIKDLGDINIQHSVNLDMTTSNEIKYDNLIKDDEKSKQEVKTILDEKAKQQGFEHGMEAEGIRLYFREDDVIFYYMPLDDSAKEFVELSVPKQELEAYINTDFGVPPAS